GASHSGDAVTSLGSTLVIKLISDKPVYSANYGIYSHRLGDQWLVGGASNSGGAALKKYFNQQEMDALTPQLKPQHPTELNYYPLPGTGERFPFNDPNMKAKINPVADRLKFFQGLLESIARIEKMGYEKLSELGCKYPERIFTTGGGAKNSAWREIRSSVLQRPVLIPEQTDAAFGSALLARRGFYG
ncbi:MAG TPA: carbohydrate kinase, partial [Thiotrichales bacterium]|nr:carbohydrate kinase [Thiotrichales bacterium]